MAFHFNFCLYSFIIITIISCGKDAIEPDFGNTNEYLELYSSVDMPIYNHLTKNTTKSNFLNWDSVEFKFSSYKLLDRKENIYQIIFNSSNNDSAIINFTLYNIKSFNHYKTYLDIKFKMNKYGSFKHNLNLANYEKFVYVKSIEKNQVEFYFKSVFTTKYNPLNPLNSIEKEIEAYFVFTIPGK
jgi:hypothetical protein